MWDIGNKPTEEEWAVYRKVFDYDQRENVAWWLEHNNPEATQEQFERMCDAYARYWREDGDHDRWLLLESWEDALATF